MKILGIKELKNSWEFFQKENTLVIENFNMKRFNAYFSLSDQAMKLRKMLQVDTK